MVQGIRGGLPHPLAGLILIAVSVAVFWPVHAFEYINYDDMLYIVDDPVVQSWGATQFYELITQPYHGTYYPVTRLSFAAENLLSDGGPAVTHTVNLVIHGLNALLLYALLLAFLARFNEQPKAGADYQLIALFCALLFAVHPQHVETVAWSVQRKELLATFFSLIAIRCHFSGRTIMALGTFLLAVLSKGSAVVVPAMVVIFDLAWHINGKSFLRRIGRSCWNARWLIIVGLAGLVLTLMTHRSEDSLYQGLFSAPVRASLLAHNFLEALGRFLAMQPGLFHQPIEAHITGMHLRAWVEMLLACAVIAAAVGALLLGSTTSRWLGAGLLAFGISIVPVGGWVIFGNYAFGDRYLYLNSIALYVALAFGCQHVLITRSPSRRRAWMFSAAVVVVVASLISAQSVHRFKDSISLWSAEVSLRPDSVFSNQQLGALLFLAGESDRAQSHFQASIESPLEPFRVSSRLASSMYIAEINCRRGKPEQAIEALRRIPSFGGDLGEVRYLVLSLKHSGLSPCAERIERWLESQLPREN